MNKFIALLVQEAARAPAPIFRSTEINALPLIHVYVDDITAVRTSLVEHFVDISESETRIYSF